MSLVTPKQIGRTYAYLRECRPFVAWNLPEACAIRFEVLQGRDHAEYQPGERRHIIRINDLTHNTLEQLFASTAHEMVHLRQELLGRLPATKDPHNREFRRMAATVCRHLGFDVQTF